MHITLGWIFWIIVLVSLFFWFIRESPKYGRYLYVAVIVCVIVLGIAQFGIPRISGN